MGKEAVGAAEQDGADGDSGLAARAEEPGDGGDPAVDAGADAAAAGPDPAGDAAATGAGATAVAERGLDLDPAAAMGAAA